MQANQQQQTTTEQDLQKFSTRLPKDLLKRLGKFCIDADLSIQQALLTAIEQYLDRQESPKTAANQSSTAQSESVKTAPPIKALEDAAHKAPFFRNKEK